MANVYFQRLSSQLLLKDDVHFQPQNSKAAQDTLREVLDVVFNINKLNTINCIRVQPILFILPDTSDFPKVVSFKGISV